MTQQNEEMTITEHLSELRKRLIYVLSVLCWAWWQDSS